MFIAVLSSDMSQAEVHKLNGTSLFIHFIDYFLRQSGKWTPECAKIQLFQHQLLIFIGYGLNNSMISHIM